MTTTTKEQQKLATELSEDDLEKAAGGSGYISPRPLAPDNDGYPIPH